MARGQEVNIEAEEGRPFPWKNQDVGHITGTDRQDPPPPSKVSVWTR